MLHSKHYEAQSRVTLPRGCPLTPTDINALYIKLNRYGYLGIFEGDKQLSCSLATCELAVAELRKMQGGRK